MDFGSRIRAARKQLGLTLKDFEERNLSFNLLSHIEMGKSKLTHQKAIMLYRRIINYSWERGIFPDLDLSDIIEDKREYRRLKNAHEFCLGLRSLKEEGQGLNEKLYRKGLKIASQNEVGALSYHILKYMADLLDSKDEVRILEVNFSILDYLRWTDMTENMEKYQTCLYDITKLAYVNGYYKSLIRYYVILMDVQEKQLERVEPKVYYNLALFNNEIDAYDEAHAYLELFSMTPSLSIKRQVNCDIVRGTTYQRENKLDEAAKYLKKAYKKAFDYDLKDLQATCLSNLMMLSGDNKEAKVYLEILLKVMECDIEIPEHQLVTYYANLASTYSRLGKLDLADIYFRQAFEITSNSTRLIARLCEAWTTYEKLDKTSVIHQYLESIDYQLLDKDGKLSLSELLLKLSLNREPNLKVEMWTILKDVIKIT